jgi:hypothetical protein
MAIFYNNATGAWDPLAWFWIAFTIASLIASGFFFGNMQSDQKQPEDERPRLLWW